MTTLNTTTFSKTLIATLTILIFTGLGAATDVASNNDEATTIGPDTTNVDIYDITIQDGGDTPIAKTGSLSPGDSLTDFSGSDNVYVHDNGDTSWTDGDDALYINEDNFGTYEASGRSIGGSVKDAFTMVDGSNDIVAINEESEVSVDVVASSNNDLESGDVVTGSNLADDIELALNNDESLTNTYSVTYSRADDEFSISLGSSETATLVSSSTTAPLGTTSNKDLNDGSKVISDNPVAFNVVSGTNDQIDVTVDGGSTNTLTLDAGAYDGSGLADNIQSKLTSVAGGSEVVEYDTSQAADAFRIKSGTEGTDSSVTVGSASQDIAPTLNLDSASNTERTGDTVITGDSNLNTESSSGTLLDGSDSYDIKYVDGTGDNEGAFDTVEPIATDSDGNGVYQDTINDFVISNTETGSPVTDSEIADLKVWKDNGDKTGEYDSGDAEVSASYSYGSDEWTINLDSSQDLTSDTRYLVTMDTASVSDTYTMDAAVETVGTSSGDLSSPTIASADGNVQTVDGSAPSVSVGAQSNDVDPEISTLTGSTSDSEGDVASVEVQIQRDSNGDYYDGNSWQSDSTTISATNVDNGQSSWTLDLTNSGSAITGHDTYTVKAEATDDVGNTASLSSGQTYYTSVDDAVEAASSDSTLTVPSGTYEETVDIGTSGITLNGDQSGNAYDATRNSESTINPSNGKSFDINAGGVTVDGFDIDGASNTRVIKTSSTGTTTIKNNIITPDSSGVDDLFTVRALGQVTFENNKISEGGSSDAFGIRSKDGDDFDSSIIDGNLFTDLKVGVQTEDDGTVTLTNNEFSNLGASGVYAVANSDVSGATYKVNSNLFNSVGNAVDFHAKNGNLEGTLEVKNNDITSSNSLSIGAVRSLEENSNTVSEVDATENWWGSEDPDFDALTTGDIVSDPWSIVQKSSMDDTTPSISTVETRDAGVPSGSVIAGSDDSTSSSNNGQIDQLVVTFDEAIQDRTIDSGDLSIDGETYSIDAVYDNGGTDSDTVIVDVEESGSSDTGATPTLSVGGAIADHTGNTFSSGSKQASDSAAPVVTGAAYRDSDDDGTVDKVDVDFSETVDYTASGTPSDDWSLTAQDITGLSVSDSTTDSSGSEITLDVSADSGITGVDSGTEPTIDVASGSPPVEDQSSSSNTAVQVSGSPVTMTDEADPVVDFSEGFNMVSFPSRVGVYDLGTLLDDSDTVNSGNIDAVWSYSNGEWKSYDPDRSDSNNEFTQVEGGQGYILEASGDGKIVADVDQEKEGYDQLSGVSMKKDRWNLVGHYEESSSSVSGDVSALSNGDGDQVVQVNPFTQISDLSPGDAYWVETSSDDLYAPVAN